MVSLLQHNKNASAQRIATSNDNTGFTLVEVLVAIAVITIIGFLPISIVSDHLIKNAITENRVAAGFLAQEIAEYVRYTRDSDILDPNGGDWFKVLYDQRYANNTYSDCILFADDWVAGNRAQYCTVECFNGADKTAQGECGTTGSGNKTYNGFIAGIATGGRRGSNSKTCDGKAPKGNNEFTTTLNIVIPLENNPLRYAAAIPCISWSDKSGATRKLTMKETIFEWIQRKN